MRSAVVELACVVAHPAVPTAEPPPLREVSRTRTNWMATRELSPISQVASPCDPLSVCTLPRSPLARSCRTRYAVRLWKCRMRNLNFKGLARLDSMYSFTARDIETGGSWQQARRDGPKGALGR